MRRKKDGEEPDNNTPDSKSDLSGNSLELPLVDFTLSAKFANDATFPFTVMRFLSTFYLAPGLHHAWLFGIFIYSV